MSNKYFSFMTAPVPTVHPRIRAWQAYQGGSGVASMRVEVTREREAFGFGPAKIVVDFLDAAGTLVRQDDADWDLALDTWLVEQGACAISPDNERLRTSLRLRRRLQPLLRELGDSYFNSLLVRVLKDGPYADHPEVGPLLARIHRGAGAPQGDVSRATDFDAVLTALAQELVAPERLKYPVDEATEILAGAVAMYLDERFSLSERQRLFGT